MAVWSRREITQPSTRRGTLGPDTDRGCSRSAGGSRDGVGKKTRSSVARRVVSVTGGQRFCAVNEILSNPMFGSNVGESGQERKSDG